LHFFPGYFVFKDENVKKKVKYGFVLYTGLSFFLFVNSGHFTNFQVGGDNPKVEEQEFS
jgi:hypothetical protein